MSAYRHTQIGTLILAVSGIGLAAMGALAFWMKSGITGGERWALIVPCALLIGAAVLFSSLTVTVDDHVRWSFGPGAFRGAIPIVDAVELRVVRNNWRYGWGIRRTPTGRLYNVSGIDAVEIVLRDGSQLRIGTDQPAQLVAAIRAASTRVK